MLRVLVPAHLRAAPMRTGPGRQRGVALILVIWVATLLLVIAGSFLYAMRVEAQAARNAALMARGDALAQAAVSRALIELFKQQGSPDVWRRDGTVREWGFEGVAVQVRFSDESAKIDLNFAGEPLLQG